MFISGCGLAISSPKEGKSGFISCLGRAYVCAFHENPNRIHSHLLTP